MGAGEGERVRKGWEGGCEAKRVGWGRGRTRRAVKDPGEPCWPPQARMRTRSTTRRVRGWSNGAQEGAGQPKAGRASKRPHSCARRAVFDPHARRAITHRVNACGVSADATARQVPGGQLAGEPHLKAAPHDRRTRRQRLGTARCTCARCAPCVARSRSGRRGGRGAKRAPISNGAEDRPRRGRQRALFLALHAAYGNRMRTMTLAVAKGKQQRCDANADKPTDGAVPTPKPRLQRPWLAASCAARVYKADGRNEKAGARQSSRAKAGGSGGQPQTPRRVAHKPSCPAHARVQTPQRAGDAGAQKRGECRRARGVAAGARAARPFTPQPHPPHHTYLRMECSLVTTRLRCS